VDRNEELVNHRCLLAVAEDGVDLELVGAVAGMRERKKTLAFSHVGPTGQWQYRNGMLTKLWVSWLLGRVGGLRSTGRFSLFFYSFSFSISSLVSNLNF
jgi:hypothetical protein